MTRTLIIAEHNGNDLSPGTAKCVTCARDLNAEIDIAVFGDAPDNVAEQAARLEGVARVLTIARAENASPLAAVLAPQIAELASEYSHVLMASTTFGKDVMPRAAALLGAPQVSDIMKVEGERTFQRPIYANNAIVTVEVPGDEKVLGTVRTASYAAADEGGDTAAVEARELSVELPTHTRFVELHVDETDRPDLQTAARVVSGGRALGSAENFEIIYRLADKLGAAVGASRAAVDAGYVPNDLQVGQTGKVIAPQLYIAVGISGAIQHLTGIKDAGIIVAINKDPEAPIFEIADIGLSGDLFQIVPELEQKIG